MLQSPVTPASVELKGTPTHCHTPCTPMHAHRQQTSSKERLREREREREEGPRTLLCSQPKASRHVPTHCHTPCTPTHAHRQQTSRKFQALPPPPPPPPAAAAAAAQPQEGEEKALLAPNPPPSQDTLPTVERSDCSTEYTSRYLTDFEPVQRLARGGLGVVCQVRNKLDENEYAVKRINLPTNYNTTPCHTTPPTTLTLHHHHCSKSSAERVKREARALAKLNHANIVVRYYNSWPETPPQDGRTPKTPCIASKSPVFVVQNLECRTTKTQGNTAVDC
ncbi:probable serine/threonine-protein kinase ifkA isoform X2 [Scylla paramamosain]|uniref:probable serine/threonine-protein kinase ifkA isoform X2 n=1 Tax=Scylla paramamosain TaxID=85552 RepID=UPI003083BBF9